MKFIVSAIFILLSVFSFSQVGPYSWQDHLSLNTCNTLARFNGKIYASNINGIVKVDEIEESTSRLNKINGLSDVGIRLLRVNSATNKLLVIYDNANMDIIHQNEAIKNYPDIKLKTINGKKAINEVFFQDKYAYLATGLGIIVFDTEKLEIKDTYVIGPNGTNLEVYQVTLNDSLIFAATPSGVYKSNYKLKILNNYNNWKRVSTLPTGIYSGVITVGDKVLASYSPSKINPTELKDTLYILNNNNWTRFFDPVPNLIHKLSYVNGTQFALFAQFGPLVMDVNTKVVADYISTYNGKDHNPKDIIFFNDHLNKQTYWVADMKFGLFQSYSSFGQQILHSINGTRKSLISNIDVFDGEVIVSPSFPNDGGGTALQIEGINHYREKNWEYFESFKNGNQYIYDINAVLFDRKDKSRIWASSWSSGLCEFKNHELVKIYNETNSPIGAVPPANTRASGLDMDDAGNLWIATSDAKEYITVRKKDGTWASLNLIVPRFTRKIMVDKNNFVWALHERDGGLTVYRHENFTISESKVLSKEFGNGNLESNSVHSIAEDKDGKIWVGTGAGIRVFYTPANIFNPTNFDAQPIKIVQDGNVELLLEKETVTNIVVDGANNKWVGTQTSGIYCFNSDGLKELYHFTKENSPLYSNNIVALNYDKVSGDIFIGTDIGLQSFRSGIIEGAVNCNDIYAFPNPVKPNYSGNVFVRGFVDESVVKITDESGNLVWETKSQGGQVEWNKKTLSGSLATTGVYVVYACTTDGQIKCTTKVLLVN